MKLHTARKSKIAGILFFDVRNFSLHRAFLASHQRSSLTTDLIQELLTAASKAAREANALFGLKPKPWMNHTGDGFLLIFHGSCGPLAALAFASMYRESVSTIVEQYNCSQKSLFDKFRVPDIGWGVGIDAGNAIPFKYVGIDETPCEGYIGSALNKASRVEAATKDHPYEVICTEDCYEMLRSGAPLKSLFIPLGEHSIRGFKRPVTLFGCKAGLHLKPQFRNLAVSSKIPAN